MKAGRNEMGYKRVEPIPLWHKINLTIPEAAEYSHIGINKIDDLLKEPGCPFLFQVGNKKLVHRESFEKYLAANHFH